MDVRHECHSNKLLLDDSCNILYSPFSNLAYILKAPSSFSAHNDVQIVKHNKTNMTGNQVWYQGISTQQTGFLWL